MEHPYRFLILEDTPADLELLLRELKRADLPFEYESADDGPSLRRALEHGTWDVVISDDGLSGYSGIEALREVRHHDPDLPFVVFSGTIGEEYAVELMRAGAQDFIPKGKPARLIPAIRRELQEAAERRARIAAQEDLRRLRERLEFFLDEGPSVIYSRTQEEGWPLVFVTRNIAKLFGYEQKEILGHWRNRNDLVHPDDRSRIAEGCEALLLRGSNVQEYRLRCKDGSYKWVSDAAKIIYGPDGTPREWVGNLTDVEEKTRAEEALAASEERYRWLVEHSSDTIMVTDEEGIIKFVSPSAKRISGYEVGELMGRSLFEMPVLPKDREKVRTVFAEVLARAGVSLSVEVRILHKDGSIRIVDAAAVNLLHDTRVSGILLSIRDITERRNMEAHLLRAQRMESIGVLAGGVAHDLNNILTPIMMTLELLHARLNDESGRRMLQTLESSVERGADLIRQILSFARGHEVEYVLIQPKHLMREVEGIITHTFPKSIDIRVEVPPDLWTVSGDATQLHQVIMNLCVNARDAMPEGGVLRIKAENRELRAADLADRPGIIPGPFMMLSVSDTGTGMTPEVQKLIFDPFFSTKEVGRGTGLGLATVWTIVNSYGGFVEVSSQVGAGSTFVLCLPAELGRKVEEQGSEEEAGATGNGELVLVVDDEAGIRELMKTVLEINGYRVLTAANGAEALEVYLEHEKEIDLAVVDMVMPVMDGKSTIQALAKLNPRLPFIAVSGMARSMEDLSDGNDIQFLQKPYTARTLLDVISKALTVRKPCSDDVSSPT